MPEFTSHSHGTPSWVDLMSPDVDASKAFYSSVFGWDAEDQFAARGREDAARAIHGPAARAISVRSPCLSDSTSRRPTPS